MINTSNAMAAGLAMLGYISIESLPLGFYPSLILSAAWWVSVGVLIKYRGD